MVKSSSSSIMEHTLSRKNLSCVTISSVLFPLPMNPSSHSVISISRWLVGSSRMSMSGSLMSILASATLFCCPPLSCPIGWLRSAILSCVRICFALSIFSSLPSWLKHASSTLSFGSKVGDCSRYPTFIPLLYTMFPAS